MDPSALGSTARVSSTFSTRLGFIDIQPDGVLPRFTPADVRAKHPERLVERAVRGMIPRNRLGRQIIKKLKVYAGPEHPHKAQAPAALELA